MIIKRRVTRQFVQLDNALVRDRQLALDEHGMLHYLLSLPDDWEVSRAQCARFWGIGRDKAARIFRALRKAGWAQVERLQTEDGTFVGVRWVICDDPGPRASDDDLAAEEAAEETAAPESQGPAAEQDAAPESQGPAAEQDAAPESQDPAAEEATGRPSYALPVVRVTRDTEKAYHGQRKSLEENLEDTKTPPHPPGPPTADRPAARPIDDRISDGADDGGEPPPRFGELLRLWPSDHVMSSFGCERLYAKLSDRERLIAVRGVKPYLDDCASKDRRICDLKTYLDERRGQRFEGRSAAVGAFLLLRATPQAGRWREYLARHEPHRLKFFDEMLATRGHYTVPTEWPPAKGACDDTRSSRGQARTGSELLTEDDARELEREFMGRR